MHELGVYDLPAIINYILDKTETRQLHYCGLSMGTTTFFIFASEKQELLNKIRSNISLAPVANIRHAKSNLKWLGSLIKKMDVSIRTCMEHVICDNFLGKKK